MSAIRNFIGFLPNFMNATFAFISLLVQLIEPMWTVTSPTTREIVFVVDESFLLKKLISNNEENSRISHVVSSDDKVEDLEI